MKVNRDTIVFYMSDTERKIELLKTDINAYQWHIEHAEKEIKTLEFLIEQYQKALEIIDGNESKE